MNSGQKFRALYRQFLFRLMDLELLSASARGDSSEMLGQFGALLVFGSLLLAWAGLAVGDEARRAAIAPRSGSRSASWFRSPC
jgi:hypothetical protein